MKKIQQQQSGMVIILAILIIAAILTTAVLLNNIITREIRQSRLIDQSIQAYYYAESGSERALHQLRQREGISDCRQLDNDPSAICNSNSYCSNDEDVPCINADGGTIGTWEVDSKNEGKVEVTLNEGETFQVDLFSPTQIVDSNVEQIKINSDSDTSIILVGELTNLTKILDVSGSISPTCSNQNLSIFKDFITTPPAPQSIVLNALGPNGDILGQCSYIFKVNYPINSTLDSVNLVISIFDKDGEPMGIPSRLIISSETTFGDSSQTVTVRTPVRPPLSGLYDFVLFSEADIIKLNN